MPATEATPGVEPAVRRRAPSSAELRLPPFLDDRLNAILVKEMRQTLRGRAFKLTFFVTLVIVLIAAITSASNFGSSVSASEAQDYFLAIYFCAVVALLGVVPFGAFQSTGSEWEDETFDLLSLTNLRPRAIVLGKLQAALVQVVLFLSVFGPFLTVAGLLRGMSVVAIVILMAIVLFASIVLSAVGVALSTMSNNRFGRVLLMVALGVGISMAIPATMEFASGVLRRPGNLTMPEGQAALVGFAACGLIALAFAVEIGANMIAHPEENRSTGVRVITSVATVVMLTFTTWAAFTVPGPSMLEMASAMGIAGLAILTVLGVLFATERPDLGRRVRREVPGFGLGALLLSPWLPGAGRGALLHVLHVGLVAAWGLCLTEFLRTPSQWIFSVGTGALAMAALFSLIYALLPSVLLSRLAARPGLRGAVRLAIPLLVLLSIVAPAIAGVVLADPMLQQLRHVGNPFWVFSETFEMDGWFDYRIWLPLAAVAVLAVLLNTPRMVRGLFEVVVASRERGAREAAERSGGGHAGAER